MGNDVFLLFLLRRLPVSPSDTKNFEDLYPERRLEHNEFPHIFFLKK